MEIVVRDSKVHTKLLAWIKLLEALNEEIKLTVNEDGISTRCMDPSHVTMIECTIPASSFDEYKVEEARDITVQITEVKKVLEKMNMNKDTLTLTVDDEKKLLVFNVKRVDGRVRRFTVNLLEGEELEVPDPKISYTAKVRLILADFREGLDSASLYTDNVTFTVPDVKEPKLRVEGKGDQGSYWDEIVAMSGETKEECHAVFTMSYLMELVKVMKPLADTITIEMATDMPIHLDVGVSAGELHLWLAPCIGV